MTAMRWTSMRRQHAVALADRPSETLVVPAQRPPAADGPPESWRVVERAQAGDTEAFAQIYRDCHDAVYTFVYWRVNRDKELAQDLTGDTFTRALGRIGTVAWQGRDIKAWLITIARNLVADHFKSAHWQRTITVAEVRDEDPDLGPEGNPEKAAVDHLSNITLLRAVTQLSAEQRECIILRFLKGLSVAETAWAMGKNEGAIKALQHRAITSLRRLVPPDPEERR